MRRPQSLLLLSLIGLLLPPLPVDAEVVVVREWGAPTYRTIQEGIDAATAGDTLFIEGGTFAETTTRFVDRKDREAVGWFDKPLTVIGTPLATITGPQGTPGLPNDGYTFHVSAPCRFVGVRFEDCPTFTIAVINTTAEVDSCHFREIEIGVASIFSEGEVLVSACSFEVVRANGIDVRGAAHATVRACLFTGPADYLEGTAIKTGTGSTSDVTDCLAIGLELAQSWGPSEIRLERCQAIDVPANALLAWDPGALIRITGGTLRGKPRFDSLPRLLSATWGGRIEASGLIISDCHTAASITYPGTIQLNDSQITGWEAWAVHVLGSVEEPTVTYDFTRNWWGTTDSTAVADAIFDGLDPQANPNHSRVEFLPLRDTPIPVGDQSVGKWKARYR